jgi:tRNA (guanine37-N1)-methyltransferase
MNAAAHIENPAMADTTTLWAARVLTLFPEMFPGPLAVSLAGKALNAGIWSLETINIRDFATDKHHTVDDTPVGGGPGMVMRPDILAAALDASPGSSNAARSNEPSRRFVLSPRGRVFDQAMAREIADERNVTFICGRFEGIDQRVLETRGIEEVSLGDFVLSGGEPAAIALIDAVVRLLPGVMGDPEGLKEESFASGLLEYPQYTRPQTWEGRHVPAVLTSGHHAEISAWRQAKAEELTEERRPDLWDRYVAKDSKR